MSDRERFIKALGALALSRGFTLTEGHIEVYKLLLEHHSIETVEQMCFDFMRPSGQDRFFPTLPEMFAGIEGSVDDKAVRALNVLEEALFKAGYYHSVTFGDPALMCVVEDYGGWLALCDTYRGLKADHVSYWQHNVKLVYSVALREKRQPHVKYFAGFIETYNAETFNKWEHGELPEPTVYLFPLNGQAKEVPLGSIDPMARLALAYRDRLQLTSASAIKELTA